MSSGAAAGAPWASPEGAPLDEGAPEQDGAAPAPPPGGKLSLAFAPWCSVASLVGGERLREAGGCGEGALVVSARCLQLGVEELLDALGAVAGVDLRLKLLGCLVPKRGKEEISLWLSRL